MEHATKVAWFSEKREPTVETVEAIEEYLKLEVRSMKLEVKTQALKRLEPLTSYFILLPSKFCLLTSYFTKKSAAAPCAVSRICSGVGSASGKALWVTLLTSFAKNLMFPRPCTPSPPCTR